ncbi:Store-operated calcium entry-associated regulatory factor [Blomia tropicalis]|nr:Store-operated calcium entry-associated regulatory factor [Blomia tropicalis]
MYHLLKFISIFMLLIVTLSITDAKQRSDRVRLEKVQTLTLNADQWTTGRRSSPLKQLKCIGGYCSRARVTNAQCYNRGFDGRDVQWECKAEMPTNYKFGKIEVICEGYDHPDDEYVLVGSCGLEYTIEETGSGGAGGYSFGSSQYYQAAKQHINKSDYSIWPIVMLVAMIALIYFTCLRDTHQSTSRSSGSSYPSDDYPDASAPPPPGFRSSFYDSNSYGSSCGGGQSSSSTRSSSSGPGFYSGMAAGGLLGYLFGSSGSNTYSRPRPSTSLFGNSDRGYYSGPSTSSGYTSGESETRTTSGFGGTRRR